MILKVLSLFTITTKLLLWKRYILHVCTVYTLFMVWILDANKNDIQCNVSDFEPFLLQGFQNSHIDLKSIV